MATISIKDAAGATQNVEAPLAPGRAAATSSRPVALSNEDYAAIDGIEALLTTLAGAVKAEDVPSANADALLIVGAMRQGTPANTSGTDGDYEPLRTSNGLLWMQMGAALPAGTNTIGNVGGPAAHDAASSGNPLLVGGYASAAAPADVSADGDAVRAWLLRNGAQAVQLTAAGTLIASGAGTASTALRATLASDDPLVAAQTRGGYKSSFTITRPANTTQYTANDAYADSGPTSGGFTLASVVGASGKSGELTHVIFDGSAAQTTPLIAELWLYDASVTAISDNAAFSSSATPIAIIPFSMTNIGSKSYAMVDCNHIAFTPSGTADLRALVRVVNAYTPVSGETLKVQAITKGIN